MSFNFIYSRFIASFLFFKTVLGVAFIEVLAHPKGTLGSGIIFLMCFVKNIMTDKKNEESSKEKSSIKETEKTISSSPAKEQSDAESTKRNNDETEKTQQEQKKNRLV